MPLLFVQWTGALNRKLNSSCPFITHAHLHVSHEVIVNRVLLSLFAFFRIIIDLIEFVWIYVLSMNIWNTCKAPGPTRLQKNGRVSKNIALKTHSKVNVSLKLKSLHYSFRENQMETPETPWFQVLSFKYFIVTVRT